MDHRDSASCHSDRHWVLPLAADSHMLDHLRFGCCVQARGLSHLTSSKRPERALSRIETDGGRKTASWPMSGPLEEMVRGWWG